MCDSVDKIDLLSETQAANMVTLHLLSRPACTTIASFRCGDHHHIGHSTLTAAARAATAACKANPFRYPEHRG